MVISVLRMSGRLLEPQGEGVPGPAEEAGGLDALEGDHGILPEGLAVEIHAQRRDALARRERRRERLLAGEPGRQLVGRALGHGHVEVRRGARAQLALAPLPDGEPAYFLALLVEAEHLVGLEAEIEE